ncbi:MAG: hypothetical protein ACJ74Q_15560 [Pyrinomonadaceae bacterium]
MAKAPTFFDYFNVRDELRGITGVEERRAIISKHVLANTRLFHTNHSEFPFDYDTPRVRELWAGVEETAEQLARGECEIGHLGGSIQAWQVTICNEYMERARSTRQDERIAEETPAAQVNTDPAEAPPDFVSKECAEGTRPKQGAGKRETPRRRAPRPPAEPTPAQPQPSSPQGSLFG